MFSVKSIIFPSQHCMSPRGIESAGLVNKMIQGKEPEKHGESGSLTGGVTTE